MQKKLRMILAQADRMGTADGAPSSDLTMVSDSRRIYIPAGGDRGGEAPEGRRGQTRGYRGAHQPGSGSEPEESRRIDDGQAPRVARKGAHVARQGLIGFSVGSLPSIYPSPISSPFKAKNPKL